MNPNNKRYIPVLVLVGAVAGGIYVMRGDKLTGQAVGLDSHMAQLGDVDNSLLGKLDGLVQMPLLPHVNSKSSQQVIGLQAQIEKLGPPALASLTTHFRDNGCFQPGSPAEVQLLGRLALSAKVTPVQRRIVTHTLIDAASHAAKQLKYDVPAIQPFSSQPPLAKFVDELRGGTVPETLPDLKGIQLNQDAIIWDCTIRSLEAAMLALQTGVVDASTLYQQAFSALQSLPKGHPASPAFARVATLAANAAKRPKSDLINIMQAPSLTDESKGELCRAGVDAKVSLSALRGMWGETPPRPVVRCLIEAGDKPTIDASLKSEHLDVRLAALNARTINPEPSDVKEALTAVYEPGMSWRERHARIAPIVRAVSKCADKQACLAPMDELESKNPELKLAGAFASTMLRAQDNRPTLQSAPAGAKDAPSLSASLASIGTNATVTLNAAIPTHRLKAGDTEKLTIDRPQSAQLAFCDKIVQPTGPAQQIVDEAFQNIEKGTLCLRAGTYSGVLELKKTGVRLVAVEKNVIFDSPVIVSQPAVLVGVKIQGPIVVSEIARGTVLASNELVAGGIAATAEVTLVHNKLGSDKQFSVPGGVVLAENARPGRFVLKGSEADGKFKMRNSVVTLDARWPPQLN